MYLVYLVLDYHVRLLRIFSVSKMLVISVLFKLARYKTVTAVLVFRF